MASPILILMFMVLCGCHSIAYGGAENRFVIVPSSSFEPADTCSDARVNLEQNHSSVWLPLANRHGPCAPWQYTTGGSISRPSFTETLRRNRARSSYMMSRARASRGTRSAPEDEKVVIPAHIGSSVDSLEYVVTVGIGTPAVQQTVLIDTGSDLSWVQCRPCNFGECSSQKDPLFDPSRSTTYSPVRCDSDVCRNLAAYGDGCPNGADNRCRFGIVYADGSRTAGVYSRDRLTLTGVDTVNNFHFGCGHDRRSSEAYDGLLALGRLPMSLVAQTSSVVHRHRGAFSYCLPAVNSRSGFLALGVRRSASAASGFVSTPLVRGSSSSVSFYEVALTGIAVGGRRLDLRPSAFAGGMMIDSGTIVTSLQSTAYRALRSAFRKAMAAYPLLPKGPLDTCFNLTGYKNVAVPKVALTFSGGATINLDVPGGILVEGCLAFEDSGAEGSHGVLGNVNQRNFEVLYDTSRSRVGFRANAC